ncbi:MAG: phage terminase large subunit [Pseudorhodoplanes sp.]|nr:phage terminase large subunit [Pseudorhodoplanes sp.]
MIKREWLRFYKEAPERISRAKIIQSWDTASKSGAQNDWSVCTTWLVLDKHYYLLDLRRGRFEYPQLRDAAIQLAAEFRPNAVLIEDASAGTALAQDIKRLVHVPVKLIRPEHDKIGRVYVQQAKFEQGLVLFPEGAPFLPELLSELLTFPQGKHDDQLDSVSQALAFKSFGYDPTFSWL